MQHSADGNRSAHLILAQCRRNSGPRYFVCPAEIPGDPSRRSGRSATLDGLQDAVRGLLLDDGVAFEHLSKFEQRRLTALVEKDSDSGVIFYRQLSRALGNRLLQIYDTVAECGGDPAGPAQ